MKRHFFFFRHGDRAGIEPESGISELGVCQAHRLGRFLSDKGIEIVYSSPLRRSIDTARIALNNPNLEIITDEQLFVKTQNANFEKFFHRGKLCARGIQH